MAQPTATYIVMAVCIAVFAYGEATHTVRILADEFGYLPARLARGTGYLGLVTHMFVHGSWMHLIVNMIVLWSFGRGLEPVMGAFRFLVLYIASGIFAALAHGLIIDTPDVVLIGASGAIAGVLGASVIAAPRLPVLFFIFPMPLWVAVITIVVLHIAAITFGWDPEIAWHAHLAGLAAGAILYPLLRRRTAA